MQEVQVDSTSYSHVAADAAWHALPAVRRLALYGLGSAVAFGILFWGNAQASSVTTIGVNHGAALVQQERSVDAVATSAKSARDLAALGMHYLEGQQTELAGIFLEAAGTKDPKYRDANVYAGYAELALADALWDIDPEVATKRTKRAVAFLEVARQADPIHSYTFELLAVGYENLGQVSLAEDARTKAEQFNVASES